MILVAVAVAVAVAMAAFSMTTTFVMVASCLNRPLHCCKHWCRITFNAHRQVTSSMGGCCIVELGALRQRVDGLKKFCLAVWAVHALDVNFDRVVAAVALRVAVIVRHFFRGDTRLDCPRAQQRYVKVRPQVRRPCNLRS